MRRVRRERWPAAARAGIVITSLAVLLTGCASMRASGGLRGATARATTGSAVGANPRPSARDHGAALQAPARAGNVAGRGRGRSGPAAGSRAEALALARAMLGRLVLPPGARPIRPSVLPARLRQPPVTIGPFRGVHYVDLHRVFAVRRQRPAGLRFLRAHVPSGMCPAGNGEYCPAIITPGTVSYTPGAVPPGVAGADLFVTADGRAGGGSLLRADAEVVWFPPRTAAEHLDPATFRAVTISGFPAGQRPAVTRRFTSAQVIAGLVGILNNLPASPGPSLCPVPATLYRLAFRPSVHGRASAIVIAGGCDGDSVKVNGIPQPALSDSGQLATAAGQLAGLITPKQSTPMQRAP
jgi:hypothetical protein